MPAQSKAQQSAFGMAYAARQGKLDPKTLEGAAKKLYKDTSLSTKQLEEYATTNRSKLPQKSRHQVRKRAPRA
jgi:hypothetical protein